VRVRVRARARARARERERERKREMENAPELDTAHRIWCTRSAVGSCRRPSHYQPKSPPEDTRACTNTNTSKYTCTHMSFIYINASICKYAGTRTHTYAYECANVFIYPYIHTQKTKTNDLAAIRVDAHDRYTRTIKQFHTPRRTHAHSALAKILQCQLYSHFTE